MPGLSHLQPQPIHGHLGPGANHGHHGALVASPPVAVAGALQVDRERVPGAGLNADRESHGGAFTHASGAAGRGPCVVGQGPLSSAILRCVALRRHKGAHNLLRMNRLELFDHTGGALEQVLRLVIRSGSRGAYEKIIAPSLCWEKGSCGGRVERAEIGTVRDKQRTAGGTTTGV